MNLYYNPEECVNQRYVMKKSADDYKELDRVDMVEMIPQDVPNILDNLPNKYKQLQMYVNSNKDCIFKIKKTDAKILYSNKYYSLRTSKAASKQLEQEKQPTEEQSMCIVQKLDRNKNTAVCRELSDVVKIIIQGQFEIVSMLQEISVNQQQVEQRQQAAEAKNEKRILAIMLKLGIEDN
ncbi:Hypothetical_protein [Hexamita inflata]|uniref:Hypothetical_protein n=1 Tax=Hexamita inflata TaxID=28002 RepID=A0ABP1I3C8_9EUKA